MPYSWRRSYEAGDALRLLTDSLRDGGRRQLFSINVDDANDVRQPTASEYAFAYNGAGGEQNVGRGSRAAHV